MKEREEKGEMEELRAEQYLILVEMDFRIISLDKFIAFHFRVNWNKEL